VKGIAYLRVSTDEQDLGLEAQRAAIAAWCAREGVRLAGEYADDGVGGGLELDRRDGLLSAIGALRRGWVLVVAKRDRLARDYVVAGLAERLASKRGARVVCADGNGNGDGAVDELLRGVLDLVAQFERAQIRMRTWRRCARSRREGSRRAGTRRSACVVRGTGSSRTRASRGSSSGCANSGARGSDADGSRSG